MDTLRDDLLLMGTRKYRKNSYIAVIFAQLSTNTPPAQDHSATEDESMKPTKFMKSDACNDKWSVRGMPCLYDEGVMSEPNG